MYHQLVKEASHEQYDERRVTVLKAHIIQLERQMITLAEAQSSRASSLMEVENALTAIADCARSVTFYAQNLRVLSILSILYLYFMK